MDLDLYLADNIDEILDNPDKYISSTNINNYLNKKSDKKVIFDENANTIVEIEKNTKQKYIDNDDGLEYEDLDEKEYLEYNQEYFDISNQYYDIDCADDDSDLVDDWEQNNKNNLLNNDNDNDNNINEDDCEDDVMDELYEKMYELSQSKTNVNELFQNFDKSKQHIDTTNTTGITNTNLIENDDGYYFFNLMNIFVKYYNNKYDKVEHFFSNIGNIEKDTTSQMELFFDAILEFKMMVEKMGLNNEEAMEQLYEESEPDKISAMFEKWNSQIYMFELNELKLFSPSLIVCLNYVFDKNLLNSDWNIYNLRDN
jgi:hypothetical protein